VVALDASGNRSQPTEVVVELPPAPRVDVALLIGLGTLVLGVGLGAFALRRLWVTQRPAPKVPEPVVAHGRHRETADAAR
jgi:predicted LPLAT superfamily acyltransferase